MPYRGVCDHKHVGCFQLLPYVFHNFKIIVFENISQFFFNFAACCFLFFFVYILLSLIMEWFHIFSSKLQVILFCFSFI